MLNGSHTVNWHLPALPVIQVIAEALIHELWKRESAVEQYSSFAVLSEDYIIESERLCRSHMGCFFSVISLRGKYIQRVTM